MSLKPENLAVPKEKGQDALSKSTNALKRAEGVLMNFMNQIFLYVIIILLKDRNYLMYTGFFFFFDR